MLFDCFIHFMTCDSLRCVPYFDHLCEAKSIVIQICYINIAVHLCCIALYIFNPLLTRTRPNVCAEHVSGKHPI